MALKGKHTSGDRLVKSTNGKAELPIKQVLRDVFTLLGRDVAAKSSHVLAGLNGLTDAHKRFRYYFTVPAIWSDDAKVP